MPKSLVIGIGNLMRRDDGVGIEVVRKLSLPEGWEQVESYGEGAELMELWQSYDQVIVVDAIHSGNTAGEIYRLDVDCDEIPKGFFNYSTHNFSLAEAISMSRALKKLPRKMLVFGIEGQDFSFGEGLSEPVEQKLDDLIQLVEQEMNNA